jgi:Ni,Fe-hydrogenase maturation factor
MENDSIHICCSTADDIENSRVLGDVCSAATIVHSHKMKITEIVASCSRKYGLPEYSSIDVFISMKATTEEQEDITNAVECLIRKCVHLAETEGKKKLQEAITKRCTHD